MATTTNKLPFIEDRIVGALISRLRAAGWNMDAYLDVDTNTWTPTTTVAATKEELYQVGDLWVRFTNPAINTSHMVRLIAGNGIDIISDWTTPRTPTNADTFDEVMGNICDVVTDIYDR